jgi:hypothetical protein
MTSEARRFVVFGFASVHDALAAESAIKSASIAVSAIPSPRALGELCGIALRLEPGDVEPALAALSGFGMTPRASAEIDDF